MKSTKIAISKEEFAILSNAGFFKAKRRITEQLSVLFAELRDGLSEVAAAHASDIPDRVDFKVGKLSKGENYLDLPYLILDFPKLFNRERVFAFRSMCWWGNGFSFQFHVSGQHWEERKNLIMQNLHALHGQDFYMCINESPWHFHFESDNYIPLDSIKTEEQMNMIAQKQFFKIGRKCPLDAWPDLTTKGQETLALCLNLFKV
jgi:hypothetical protein